MFGAGVAAGGAFVVIRGDSSQFRKELAVAQSAGQQFVSGLNSLGNKLLTSGLFTGAAVGLAAREFARLDDELRAIQGITGATRSDFEALTDTIRGLGASTSFTAQEVAQAAKELARGGQSAQQIAQTLPAVLDLARGTQTEFAEAAATTVRVLGQFQLEAAEAAEVVDVLSKAANSGTFNLEDLGESLKFLGPIASSLNFSLQEVSAAFSVLADNGLRGGIAGRQLRRVFFELTNEAKRAKLAEELGLDDLVSQQGDFGSLQSVLEKISAALQGLAPAARVNLVEEIFGEGAAALEGLVKGVDDFNDALADIRLSANYARDLARNIDEGLGGAFRLARSAVQELGIAVGDALQDDLIAIVKVIRQAGLDFAKFAAENKGLLRDFLSLAVAVTALGATFKGVSLAFSTFRSAAAAVAALRKSVAGLSGTAAGLGVLLGPIGQLAALAVSAGLALNGLVTSTSAYNSALAEIEAATPIARTVSEAEKLQTILARISEKAELDPEDYETARAAIKKLEEQYGPLGIVIDEVAGKIRNLEEAQRRVDLARTIENNQQQLPEAQAQLEQARKALDEALASDEEVVRRGVTFLTKQFDEAAARVRFLTKNVQEFKDELASLGDAEVSTSIRAPEGPRETPFDEERARDVAQDILKRADQVRLREAAGEFGGRDLGQRQSERSVRIAELQLKAEERSAEALEELVEYFRNNPGLLVGA